MYHRLIHYKKAFNHPRKLMKVPPQAQQINNTFELGRALVVTSSFGQTSSYLVREWRLCGFHPRAINLSQTSVNCRLSWNKVCSRVKICVKICVNYCCYLATTLFCSFLRRQLSQLFLIKLRLSFPFLYVTFAIIFCLLIPWKITYKVKLLLGKD